MIVNARPGQIPARLQLVDVGQTRRDLASRKEIKYTLPDADVGKLRSLLQANCRRLIHNERVSVVRSIYYDDARLSACRANLAGTGQRHKLRLRWYDSLRPQTDFFLEIKWRDNRITGKRRLHFKSDVPLSQLSYPQLGQLLEQVTPPQHRACLYKSPDPIVIVQYQREHFASADGLRVTLDYDMTYYDQTGKQFISTNFPRRLGGLAVVEGKTPVGREAELPALFYPLTPRVGRCSKYVHGCRLFGLIGASE